MAHICFVSTTPAAVNAFLRPIIADLAKSHDITVITNGNVEDLFDCDRMSVVSIKFQRKPSVFHDILTFLQLVNAFKIGRFDVVHSIMPKTGLLSVTAALFVRVPIRLHTFTGQVWARKTGLSRRLLMFCDYLVGRFATNILVDSHSQLKFLRDQNVLGANIGQVIGSGSVCGVDVYKFNLDPLQRLEIRKSLCLLEDAVVILYIGRLTRDKGIFELAAAFTEVAKVDEMVHLLLVGAEEDVLFGDLAEILGVYRARVHYLGFSSTPHHFMTASDIFCLPSYREGFGQVVIEAGASCLPVVATDIYGLRDSVIHNVTGFLVQPFNHNALCQKLTLLISDQILRRRMGKAARDHVIKEFEVTKNTSMLAAFYRELLDGRV